MVDESSELARLRTRVAELEAALHEKKGRPLDESLLWAVVEHLPVGIWFTDGVGNIVYGNPASSRIWGGAPFVGKEEYQVYKAFSPETGAPLQAEDRAIYRAHTRGETISHQMVDIETFDGHRKTLLVSAIPLQGGDGHLATVLVVNEDITERRRAETALARDINERKAVEQRLRAAVEEKDTLLRELHHRVKNNLQVILSLINLRSYQVQDPTVRAILAETQNRIHAIAYIHETLHRLPGLARIDLGAYLDSLCGHLFQTFGMGGRVERALDVDKVELDVDTAIRCGLLVNELVSNSLRHAFPMDRTGRVSIRAHATPDGLLLRVADNGVGLPPNLDYRKATSLGLQLVCTLAQHAGGLVECESAAPGTAFKITLRSTAHKQPG